MKECPFCLPQVLNACFAESQNFRAIYNIAPILPGHCLIIPKNHLLSFLKIPEYELIEMVKFSRKVIQILNIAFNTDAYNWTIQDGIPAGQTIPHFHLHIIPRQENDLREPGDWYPKLVQNRRSAIDSSQRERLSADELHKIVSELKKQSENLTTG